MLTAAGLFGLVAAPLWLARGVNREHRAALLASGFIVLVPAGFALAVLPPMPVLLVLLLVWIADTAAYFVGRAWGRRKLAPSISPGKTWEGVAGGVFGALAYAIICGGFVGHIAWAPLRGGAAALRGVRNAGDLLESARDRRGRGRESGG